MRGRPFPKGHRGPGRPKGSKNKSTIDQNLLTRAAAAMNGPDYWQNVYSRITRGKAPHAESYLMQRLHGRPVEQVELSGPNRKPLKVTVEVVRE